MSNKKTIPISEPCSIFCFLFTKPQNHPSSSSKKSNSVGVRQPQHWSRPQQTGSKTELLRRFTLFVDPRARTAGQLGDYFHQYPRRTQFQCRQGFCGGDMDMRRRNAMMRRTEVGPKVVVKRLRRRCILLCII